MPDSRKTPRSRQSVRGPPKRSLVSCFVDPGRAGMLSNADIDKPHLKELAETMARYISSPSRAAGELCISAITAAQHQEGTEHGSTRVDLCDTEETFQKRLNGGSSWSVVTEQQPTLCFTKADADIRSAQSLLSQGPRDGKTFTEPELRKLITAAKLVGDHARLKEVRMIQNPKSQASARTAVTGPSVPSENEDAEDFAQTAPDQQPPSSTYACPSAANDSGRAKGATWRICPANGETCDPLTNDDFQSTKLSPADHKLLYHQDPVTGKIEARSNRDVKAPLFWTLIQTCATLNGPKTSPTGRMSGLSQALTKARSKATPSGRGYQEVKDSADWDVLKRRRSEYFPVLTGPDLTTADLKRKLAYEGDPTILSLCIITEKRRVKGAPSEDPYLEALISHQGVSVGSAIVDLLRTCARLNKERPEDFVDQLYRALETATKADDSVNGVEILLEENPNLQYLRRSSGLFLKAVSLDNPYAVSPMIKQPITLKSEYSSNSVRT